MSVLDHWHPVLRSKEVREKPVGIRLDGKELVVFRGASGRIGCLQDTCPHRRMRLSLGNVVNDSLRCRYHGWTYDCEGRGTSPAMPKLHARAVHFDTMEAHGAIWVKSARSSPDFPHFDTAGFYHLGNLSYIACAPLELVLDNLTEIEHTPTTHRFFGYDLDGMGEVDVQFEPTDTRVRSVNHGPSRRMPSLFRLLLGIRSDFHFNDEWTVFFSPVYAVFDHYWKHPKTGQESKARCRVYVFLVPLDAARTLLQIFAYMKSTYPGPYGGLRLVWPVMIRLIKYEISQDISIVDNLADKSPGIQGMKLGHFDPGLSLNRERIDRIYRAIGSDVAKCS